MNLNPTALHHINQENSLERFLGELADRRSLWHDLRVAEMSGHDYVFVPDAACRQLNSVSTITSFLNNVQTILGSSKTRTLLIGYWHDRYREQHFEKYCVKWSNGAVMGVERELLNGSPQFDFIKMLFEHSEKLIVEG